jgi:hypothetical protein
MTMNHHITSACLVFATAVALASCGDRIAGRASGTSATSSTGPTATSATTTTTPATETTGTEKPGPTGNGGVVVSFPGLPAGGQSDDTTVVHQCMAVSWLGDNGIPDGVSVVVTGAVITPRGLFDWGTGGSDCGSPRCPAPFAFTSKTTRCVLPVTAKGTGGSGELLLTGEARCGAGHEQKCRDLVAHEKPQTLPLVQPRTTTTETTTATTDPPTPTS